MKRVILNSIFTSPEKFEGKEITVAGWARNIRTSNAFGFIMLNDGSYFTNLQVVIESSKIDNYKEIASQNIGASLIVKGTIVLTPDAPQPFELHASAVEIEGTSTPDYPIQNKRHTPEYLRSIAHLRPRANTFYAVFRVRSVAAYAIHKFFQEEKGFVYAQTPLITGSDCEGAGEMFRVTTLDPKNPPLTENGDVDFSKDFFGKRQVLRFRGSSMPSAWLSHTAEFTLLVRHSAQKFRTRSDMRQSSGWSNPKLPLPTLATIWNSPKA